MGLRWLAGAGVAVAVFIAAVAGAWAEDSDEFRWYFHFKARDTNRFTGVHDYYGFGLGANLNRHFGVELSGDRFEIFPERRGDGKQLGEYGVFALMPQFRARYPLFGDQLVPYVLAGAGVALTDFNDRKQPAFGVSVKSESLTPVGTLGAGVEYFLDDNISIGVEFKYLFAGEQTLTVGGVGQKINASAPLTSIGVRLYYPELRPAPMADAREPTPTRLYLGLRIGVALPTDTDLTSEIEARPVPVAWGDALAQYFGIGLGLDLNRYLGVELAIEGFEVALARRGLGSIGEYAIYTAIPQLRLRYPLAEGRLVPYGLLGVGLAHAEWNDRKPRAGLTGIEAKSNSVAASVGAGIEYFVTRNIALGLESKYLYSPGHEIKFDGRGEDATIQAVAVTFGLRIYLATFGR
jgi:opacity protein-like surface antigen